MNKLLFTAVMLMVSVPAMAASDVCGKVTKGSKNAQLIPVQGLTKIRLSDDEVLSCGAMLITHEDAVWVELTDLTVFKIAPNSFFEFSKKEGSRHQLYRGEALVSAPPSIREFELTTPNSISVFHGGVMLVRYQPKAKETTLASFNRKISFKNKFHTDAAQVVNSGEMSRLWIGESRIVPTQPEVMNYRSVKAAVQGFGLTEEEVHELTAIVQRTTESRSKSLVADLESWEDISKESEQAAAERSIASVDSKTVKVKGKQDSSIDPKEAETGLGLLKKHLYGDAEDNQIFEESRKPASVRSEKLKDVEYQRKKAKENAQMKKVFEDIRNFDPEND